MRRCTCWKQKGRDLLTEAFETYSTVELQYLREGKSTSPVHIKRFLKTMTEKAA